MKTKKDGPEINAFILPTEDPLPDSAIKRAMLTFDSVLVPDPQEKCLVPDGVIVDHYPGMTITQTSFVPYPRIISYERMMKQTLSRFATQIENGSIRIVNPNTYKDLPFRLIRQTHNWAVGDLQLLETAATAYPDTMSADDVEIPNGVFWGCESHCNGYPSPYGPYPEPKNLPFRDERFAKRVTPLSMVRVGQAIKYLLFCERVGATPLSLHESQSKLIDLLYAKRVVSTEGIVEPLFELAQAAQSSLAIREFVLEEIIAPGAFDQLSTDEVERLKDGVWGTLQALRRYLHFEVLKAGRELLSASCKEKEDFLYGKLAESFEQYRKAEAEFISEISAKGIKIGAKALGSVVAGSSAATLIGKLLSAPSWGGIVTLCTGLIGVITASHADDIADVWRRSNDLKRLPFYGLMRKVPKRFRRD